MKTKTLNISEDLHGRLKVMAARRGVGMQELVEELLALVMKHTHVKKAGAK